jgi:hypothetical protein
MKNFRLDVKKVIEKEKLSMQSGSSVTFLSASFITADSGSIIQFHSPILIPVASASVSRPGAGTGSLYVKSTDNKIYFQTDGGTEYDLTDTGGGGGSPGGSDTQVQYNDGGSFGGAADLTFNDSTGDVTVGASTGDAKLFFRDSGIYAYSKADGELDIVSDTRLGLTGSGDLPSAIGILASAGGIDIDAVGAAGQDINITNTGGSVNITATEDVINAVSITSNNIYFNGGDQDDAYLFYSKPLYLDVIAWPATATGKLWSSSGYVLNWGGLGFQVTGSGHFNITGGDYDFRVEGDSEQYLIWTDGSEDMVHLGGVQNGQVSAVSQGYSFYKDLGDSLADPYGFSADGEAMGEIIYFPDTGTTLSNVYYLTDSAAVAQTDAGAESTAGPVMLLLATTTNAKHGMLVRGYARIDSTTLPSPATAKVGDPIYLSTTAGLMTFTAPSGSGDVVRIIGYCIQTANSAGSSIIYFNPSTDYIVLS